MLPWNMCIGHPRRSTPLMKTVFVLVIGLVATIWSGTPDDTVGLTSPHLKHGANMQGSLLFQAFHRKSHGHRRGAGSFDNQCR